MKGKQGYWFCAVLDLDEISNTRLIKSTSLEKLEAIAREQPIYIEPSQRMEDVRKPAIDWLKAHERKYSSAKQAIQHTTIPYIEEV